MSTPILATKLYIPLPRPKVVLRPRLLEQLNEGQHRKMTLITAPAGYGKTTLLSEWIPQSEHCVTWVSLDDGDNDPVQFWAYFIAALQMLDAEIGRNALALMRTPVLPPIEAILAILLSEIAAFPNYFALVLDDYHLIDSKPIDNALTFLLEHLPRQMHLVIATREDPNLPLARLRARDQLTELRVADLRFTPSEAADFLNQTMGLNLSAEDIAALENRTEGWIAGLQLAAISMRGQQDATRFIQSFTGTHRFVLDYLVEEVLQQQSERVKNFLLGTSILDRMCGSLCEAVLLESSASGQETLEHLERANLFIMSLDNERRWYRYHHLFGSLLRQRQGQSLTPEEIARYHIRASEWHEKNGDEAEAFHHAVAARDFNRAARVAETAWESMNQSFQSAAWLGWVKQLPEELIRSRPVLCTQIAWGFMDASEVDASESRLRDAERCLEGPSDKMVVVNEAQFRALPARIAFARAYNAQTQRDFLSTVKYAELAFKLTPEENHFLRAQTAAILGGTYWANGDLDKACRSMSDWIASSQRVGNFFFAVAGASGKADILTAQGLLREALRTYQQALQLASAHEKEAQRIIAHHHLGLAMLYHEMGDDEAAAPHLQKSLELGKQSALKDWHYRLSRAQARLKESEGDLTVALDLLDEAERLYVRSLTPYTRPIDAVKARIYLKQGRLSKAEEWARERGLSIEDELSYLHEFEHITLTRVLLAEYQRNRDECSITNALALLERLLKAAEDQKRMGSLLEILVMQALAYQTQGETPQAFAALERALNLAEPEGYVRIFVDEGESMRLLVMDFRLWLEKKSHDQGRQQLIGYMERLLAGFARLTAMPHSNTLVPILGSSVRPAHREAAGARQASAGVSHPESALIEPLSERELEVLRLLGTELNGPEIARQLMVSLSTLRTHTQNIYSKLGVNNRRAAVRRAEELDLL
jgi:LuxR family maltose regulon positive regulatory protein